MYKQRSYKSHYFNLHLHSLLQHRIYEITIQVMGWKTFFIYKNHPLNWVKSLKKILTSSSYKSFEPMPLPIWNRLSHAREYNINHVRIPQPISSYVVRGDKHRINLRTHDIRVKQRSYTHDTLKSRLILIYSLAVFHSFFILIKLETYL